MGSIPVVPPVFPSLSRRRRLFRLLALAALLAAAALLALREAGRRRVNTFLGLLEERGFRTAVGHFSVRLVPSFRVEVRDLEGTPREGTSLPEFKVRWARLRVPYSGSPVAIENPVAIVTFRGPPWRAQDRQPPAPSTPRPPDPSAPSPPTAIRNPEFLVEGGAFELNLPGRPPLRIANRRTLLSIGERALRIRADADLDGGLRAGLHASLEGRRLETDPFTLNMSFTPLPGGGMARNPTAGLGLPFDLFFAPEGSEAGGRPEGHGRLSLERRVPGGPIEAAADLDLPGAEAGLGRGAGGGEPLLFPLGRLAVRLGAVVDRSGRASLTPGEIRTEPLAVWIRKGEVDLRGDGRLEFSRMEADLGAARRLLPRFVPASLSGGFRLEDGTLRRTPAGLEVEGRLDLSGLAFLPEGPFRKKAGTPLAARGAASGSAEGIFVREPQLEGRGLSLRARSLSGKNGTWVLEGLQGKVDAAAFGADFGAAGWARPSGGTFALEGVGLEFSPAARPTAGTLRLSEVAWEGPGGGAWRVSGSAAFAGGPAEKGTAALRDVVLQTPAVSLRGKGTAGGFGVPSGLKISLALEGDTLDLEALAPLFAHPPQPGGEGRAVPPPPAPPTSTGLAFEADLALTLRAVACAGLRAEEVKASLKAGNATLALDFTGTFQGGRVEVAGARFDRAASKGTARVRIRGAILENLPPEFLQRVLPLAAGARGRLDAEAEVSVSGEGGENPAETVQAAGRATVAHPDLSGTPLLKADILREILGVKDPEGGGPLDFHRAESAFSVGREGTQVNVRLVSRPLVFGLKGRVGHDGALDLFPFAEVRDPRLRKENPLIYLGEDGKFFLRVGGTLDAPEVRVELPNAK